MGIDIASAGDLFRRGVVVEEATPLPEAALLLPEEAPAVATACATRRREFAAGRCCARRALSRLGIDGVPLPANPDRTPSWPAGVVGSITHTDRYCVAAVAPRDLVLGIGVDAEPDEPLERELWDAICTPFELRWLATLPAAVRGRLVRLIFSAKESIFKAQFPLTGAYLEFHDATLTIERGAGRFVATLQRAAGISFPAGTQIYGRFGSIGGTLVTAVELRPS